MGALRPAWLLLIFAGTLPSLACAQVVECIDAQGHKEYTQKCPEGSTQQKELKIVPRPPPDPYAPPSAPGHTFQPQRTGQQDQSSDLDKNLAAAKKQLACADARKKLDQLESGQRLRYGPNSSPEKRNTFLDDADREKETHVQQYRVTEYCDQ